MMSSYVCRQCRTRLGQRAAPLRKSQWQPRATFISLRGERAGTHAEPQSKSQSESQSAQDLPNRDAHPAPTQRKWTMGVGHTVTKDRPAPARPGRYSRHLQSPVTPALGMEAGAVEHAEDDAFKELNSLKIEDSQQMSHTHPIQVCLHQGRVAQAWALFLHAYPEKDCPALKELASNDAPLVSAGQIFSMLLNGVLTKFCKGMEVPVTPSAVLFRYEQLGIVRLDMWKTVLGYLSDQLLLAVSESSQQRAESILQDLLHVWKLFFQCKGSNVQDRTTEPMEVEWSSVLDVQGLAKFDHTTALKDFGPRLQHFHPGYINNEAVTFSAVTIFNVFHPVGKGSFDIPDLLRQQATPLVQFITRILASSKTSHALKHIRESPTFAEIPHAFQDSIIDQVNSAPARAKMAIGTGENPVNLEEYFHGRISRAVFSQSNVSTVEKLWAEVLATYTSQGGKPAVPSSLYNAFLSGYMTMYRSERAVETWNHMVAHGIKPDVKTWTAMLQGCEKAKDRNGLSGVWAKMLAAGVEPDNYAWTARIHALASFRRINETFAALDEMGKKWLAAENMVRNALKHRKGNKQAAQPVNQTAKPSIEVINAAVAAIAAIPPSAITFTRQAGFIHKILTWAGNFQIRPDVRTFNTLIKLYSAGGDYATVSKILGQMEREGIETDLATHTILVNASFDNNIFKDLSQSEQTERILELFLELESGGFKLNSYLYSSAIDRLLKYHNNFPAVRAIINHMMARGIIPSPYIYTSLTTHYFQQDPPNIEAVDSLWMQILKTPGSSTDKQFYDRLIEGYAAHGEVGKMMAVLTRMSADGKLPAWPALAAVVRALLQADDWERARNVVRDVQMGKGVAAGGIIGGTFGQRDFYALVRAFDPSLIDPLAGGHWQGGGAANADDAFERSHVQDEFDGGPKADKNGAVAGVPLW